MAVLCSPLTSMKVNFDDFEYKRNRCRIDFDGFEWFQKTAHHRSLCRHRIICNLIDRHQANNSCFAWSLGLCFAIKRHHVLQLNWNVNVAASNECGFMKLSLPRQWQARVPKNFTSPSNRQYRIMQKRVIWLHKLTASLAAHPAMKWSSSLHFGRSSIPFANEFQSNRMQDASPALCFCCAKYFPRVSRPDRQFNGNQKQQIRDKC